VLKKELKKLSVPRDPSSTSFLRRDGDCGLDGVSFDGVWCCDLLTSSFMLILLLLFVLSKGFDVDDEETNVDEDPKRYRYRRTQVII